MSIDRLNDLFHSINRIVVWNIRNYHDLRMNPLSQNTIDSMGHTLIIIYAKFIFCSSTLISYFLWLIHESFFSSRHTQPSSLVRTVINIVSLFVGYYSNMILIIQPIGNLVKIYVTIYVIWFTNESYGINYTA